MRWRHWTPAALVALSCGEVREPPATPAPRAVFGGCVDTSDACILEEPKTLTVWLDVHAATPLLVRIDGRAFPSKGRVLQGGVLLDVAVPEGGHELSVESPDTRWERPVTLAIEWKPHPPIDGLSVEQLEAFVASNSGWAKLRALDVLRRRRELSRAERLAAQEAELELAREEGLITHQTNVLAARAHDAIERLHDHDKAQAALEGLGALAKDSLLAQARRDYFSAILSRRTGDLGRTLEQAESGHLACEKLNYGVHDVLELRASTLAELGRHEEARVLLRQLEDELWGETLVCEEWVRIANNWAWMQLVLGGAGFDHRDPRPLLLTALDRSAECPATRGALLLDLAMAELEYERPAPALGWLSEMNPGDYPGWVEMLRTAAAVEAWDVANQPPLVSIPPPTPDVELVWNQRLRRGDLLSAWGFDELAVEAYQAAENELTATFEQVGTDKQGELYLAGRSSSLRGLVDALVRLGRVEEASCAIRLARAREFARLDRSTRATTASSDRQAEWNRELEQLAEGQRETASQRAKLWDLSKSERELARARIDALERENRQRLDQTIRGLGLEPSPHTCTDLRPPGSGEVILVGYESEVFALSTDGVEVVDRNALSKLDGLAEASLLTLIQAGQDPETPLHLLPWREAPSLLDVAPVGYSLDLRPRPTRPKDGRTALLVADPRGDLVQARREADDVARILSANAWTITDLRGTEAKHDRLVELTPTVDLFHFAGHGVRSGISGWDSALILADDQRFGIHDVFTLATAPRGVVLTGCETAAPTPDTVGGGMNIARAFILAGSEWVIAASARVDDTVAARVGAAIHEADGDNGPARLRNALLRLRSETPEIPWQHYRALTP